MYVRYSKEGNIEGWAQEYSLTLSSISTSQTKNSRPLTSEQRGSQMTSKTRIKSETKRKNSHSCLRQVLNNSFTLFRYFRAPNALFLSLPSFVRLQNEWCWLTLLIKYTDPTHTHRLRVWVILSWFVCKWRLTSVVKLFFIFIRRRRHRWWHR